MTIIPRRSYLKKRTPQLSDEPKFLHVLMVLKSIYIFGFENLINLGFVNEKHIIKTNPSICHSFILLLCFDSFSDL